MTLPQSELKKAMNNQKITIIGLAKEFKYSRQTLSRKRNDFMGGVELREKDLQKKFEKILLDEEIRRNSEAGKSVSAENRLAIRMTNESIKDCLKQLQLLSKDTSPIELSGCAPSENWKNAIIGSTPEEHLSEVNTLLSSLEDMLNELEYYKRNEWEIDEVEDCCAQWDAIDTSFGNPIQYHDGFITSFGMIKNDQCQIIAEVNDGYYDWDAKLNITADIYVATDKALWVVKSKKCESVNESEVYQAQFDNLIPGYRYFFQVRYSRTKKMELPFGPDNEIIEYFVEKDGKYVEGETDFHPLK